MLTEKLVLNFTLKVLSSDTVITTNSLCWQKWAWVMSEVCPSSRLCSLQDWNTQDWTGVKCGSSHKSKVSHVRSHHKSQVMIDYWTYANRHLTVFGCYFLRNSYLNIEYPNFFANTSRNQTVTGIKTNMLNISKIFCYWKPRDWSIFSCTSKNKQRNKYQFN